MPNSVAHGINCKCCPNEDEFNMWFNDVNEPVELYGLVFYPSDILKLDGPAYREAVNNWFDMMVSSHFELGEEE